VTTRIETVVRRSDTDEIAPVAIIEGVALTPPQGTIMTIGEIEYSVIAAPEVSISTHVDPASVEPADFISVFLAVAAAKGA
jgi:hypothetical protein